MSETLKSLEELYIQKKYLEARDKLLGHKAEMDEGAFHYNLGTIYGKLGDYAAGRYNLELALKKGFQGSKVYKNLNYFKNKIPVRDIDSSPALMDQFLSYGANSSFQMYLSGSLLLLLMALILIHKKRVQKVKTMILCLCFSLVPLLSFTFYFKTLKVGVLLSMSELREGPSRVYEKIDELTAGTKLIFGTENDGWVLIERPHAFSGWVEKKKIGFVGD